MGGHQAIAFLLVFIGGGIGSLLRHAANLISASVFGLHIPAGTVFVNISGSLAMGLLAGWFAFRGHSDQLTRLFLTTGILGGFTTFSAFSLEAALLLERGQTVGAALYIIGSVVIAIAGVFAGIAIMRALVS